MEVDTKLALLFEKLKVEDPWLPPRNWESIPSQSGPAPPTHPPASFQSSSCVSERSLVRLALNALQGVESALISIEKLSSAFCSEPADRTFHKTPSLWNRSTSTHALGQILKSIGCLGSLVFLIHKFVDHFTNLNFDDNSTEKGEVLHHLETNKNDGEVHKESGFTYSLVNQAFSVAVRKVLEGYTCALDTLCASAVLRRSSKSIDLPLHAPSGLGCLSTMIHSELTLLEVYLHTKELRTQIEALGNICKLHDVALCFLDTSFEDLNRKATLEFYQFHRGGDLLTYLYSQLKVADPAHRALLKFLFLRSFEPYCGFIRSWIFKAEICDPYKEFVVEYVDGIPNYSHRKDGTSPVRIVRERDGALIPCFLKNFLIPLMRAGQQLQVVMKLLELCNYAAPGNHAYADLLPCWTGFLKDNPFYASPMTFVKRDIQAMVSGRSNYYKTMQEKLEKLQRKLEVYPEMVTGNYTIPILYGNDAGSLNSSASFMLDDKSIASSTTERAGCDANFDDYSTEDELPCMVDAYDSSECSSLSGSSENPESGQLIEFSNSLVGLKQNYLSTLNFYTSTPTDNSLQNCLQIETSCHTERDSNARNKGTDGQGYPINFQQDAATLGSKCKPCESGDSIWPCYVQYDDSPPGKCWPLGSLLRNPFYVDGGDSDDARVHQSDIGPKVWNRNTGFVDKDIAYFSESFASGNELIQNKSENQLENDSSTSNLFQLQVNHHSKFLSMNPMLTKSKFNDLMGGPGGRSSRENKHSLPCFDFSSVDDPCKVYMAKVPASSIHELFEDSTVASRKIDHCRKPYTEDNVLTEDNKILFGHIPLDLKDHNQKDVSKIVSGGGGWESLLGVSNNPGTNNNRDLRQSLSDIFEIPIDFVVDKCLVEEILLQYNYVSKLTIKLLEEGFALQEHLLALRRYHFMEVADWTDIFVKSLWHHKWRASEADQGVAEIHGLLELSVQRSSCERDCYKDRLYVYAKGQGIVPLSTSAIGLHSFDFLGLGYRVDWPISIILTPGALRIYADIFSFLIQVKLAFLSLTDVWCSLKDLMHPISQHRHSEQKVDCNVLMKLRHQVNHFVSALQQYVQSHLSHVSWCKFLHSLKHKVKDMMDIESVHMAYLTESRQVCFLSDETRATSTIIESILQCALDLRSCIAGGLWDAGQGELLSEVSKVNVSQVLAIKQKFDANLKDLHICYLKSPKHREFGLSRFWGYLNYNEYYSDAGNELSLYGFQM